MTLSDPEFIAAANAYTVPVNIDKNTLSERSPLERRLCPPSVGVGVRLLTADGQPIPSMRAKTVTTRDILDTAARLGLAAAPSPWRYVASPPAHRADDLVLAHTARFLPFAKARLPQMPAFRVPLNIGAQLDSEQAYALHLHCPTREWIVLPRSEWRGLRPRDDTWALPPPLVSALLYRARPPTHYSHLDPSEVEDAALEATVAGRRGAEIDVCLRGRVRARQRWYPTKGEGVWMDDLPRDEHRATATIIGSYTWDTQEGRVRALRLVTEDGTYRGPEGTDLRYAAAAMQVDDAAAAPP